MSPARTPLTGSRIRAIRMDRRLRQSDLARDCDISASYLNLIEHNRRRIGGALLNRLAKALQVDPTSLSEGADTGLTAAIESAAVRYPGANAELDRVEEIAGRFPGWARLVRAQAREISRLERVIEGLNDRLTHDPFLSASLHDVLSSVTAIGSASAILADGGEIAPEWQSRFHRNILEDSNRLAQSTKQLVAYLDAGSDIERGMSLPHEDVETWLEAQGWTITALEQDSAADIDVLVDGAPELGSAAARHLARQFLRQYAGDARTIGRADLIAALGEVGADPAVLAARFGVALPVVFRRLASLPAEVFPDGHARGLVACDGSGTLVFRKPVPGFDLPRYGAACPLWSLFQALQRPMQPIRQVLRMTGRDRDLFQACAVSEMRYPDGFDAPPVVEAWMMLEPCTGFSGTERVIGVGTSCRVCAIPECSARREPSLIAAQGEDGDSQIAKERHASF